MNYQAITREECSDALGKIFNVLSRIILNPQDSSNSDYSKAAQAFNALADEGGFTGDRFLEINFDENYHRDAAKLFYGVGETTIGLTHSFWSGGLITVTGEKTHEAFKVYQSKGLRNTSNLPDDHIVVELDFLSCLLGEGKVEEAQQYVGKEILAWWPTAEENIDEKSGNQEIKDFFASVSTALRFVESM